MNETKTEKIRLACMCCDTDDGDGTFESIEEAVAAGWEEGIQNVGPSGLDSGDWWDHLGYCPKCKDDPE